MTPVTAEEDVKALLEQVDRFALRSVEPHSRRPAEPMRPQELRALLDEARLVGIVSGEEDSAGALWEGAPDAWAASLSVQVLRRLARTNAGFALAAHRSSLAISVARRLNMPTQGRGVAAVQGRFGLGRLSLARYVAGAPLEDEDLAIIADYYAPSAERLLTADDTFDWLLAPVVTTAGVVDWILHPREALCLRRLEHAHGIDELATFAFRPTLKAGPQRTTTLDPAMASARLGEALALEALGLLAIALGAAEHAYELARAYASARNQGGRPIDRHPAVQLLLSSSRTAIVTVEALLESAARRTADATGLPRILAARAEAHPLLCRAANDALQVFGGTGYMRDAGAEKIVRDENHLRACSGSPMELSLFVAERSACMPEPTSLPRVEGTLEGHVASTSSLSPHHAFGGLSPIVRPLVRYERRDPWDLDTESLPKPLAEYRRVARAFAVRHLRPRELSADLDPHPPPGECSLANLELLRAAGREGFLSDLLPRPLGSMHARLLPYALFLPQALKAEEFAAVDGGLMLLVCAHDLGVVPLILSGEMRTIRRHLLPAFRASEGGQPHLFAYAITEPAAGSDVEDGHGAATLRRPGVVATRQAGGGYRIRGRKCFISGGDIAKGVVVFAALEGEGMESWTAFLVPRGAPGFRVARTELKMGMRASGAAELELDDVFVTEDAVIGGLRNGWALNRATLNMSRIPVAAMAVGFARAATEEATSFACRFRLAGKPLVSFQEVQLALAQMMAETSAARSMVWQIAARRQARQAEASAAKFYCSDTARRVCEMAMDLMSNHSVLHENRVEKAFRDARLTQIFEGTNQINRLGVIEDAQERLLEAVEAARPE